MINQKNNESDPGMDLVELTEKENLDNPEYADNQIVPTRLFKSLTPLHQPIEPLPIDTQLYLHYETGFESRCQICTSCHRTRAEHIYIEEGGNAYAVVRFFEKFYAARLGWSAVKTHMTQHVNLRKTNIDPSKLYIGMGPQADIWRGQEDELALRILIEEIQSVKGIDSSRNVELKLKCAVILEKLADRVLKIKKDRDANGGVPNVDIRLVLKSIHDSMLYEEDRVIIREKVAEILESQKKS